MTTRVTVDAHAGWPVEVVTIDQYGDKPATEATETVAPNTVREFYVTNSRTLRISELPRPTEGVAS